MRPGVVVILLVLGVACDAESKPGSSASQGTPKEGGKSTVPERAPSTKAVQVVAGNYNACVRWDDGSLSCWGRCGMGCSTVSHETSTGMQTVDGIDDAVDVAVGDSFACAAQRDGQVRCWGSNFDGAVGVVGDRWIRKPRVVEGVADVVEVETTQTMTCARTRDGDVFVWGGVADGDPPPPESTRKPKKVPALAGATTLHAIPHACCGALGSGDYACVYDGGESTSVGPARPGDCGCRLDARGHLKCEARGLPGPPTIDGTQYEPPLMPCSIESLDGVRDFAIAGDAGYAIRNDGELWRWGEVSQLRGRVPLERMAALPKVRSLATGVRGAVFAVDDGGTLWGWGWSLENGITDKEELIDEPVKMPRR